MTQNWNTWGVMLWLGWVLAFVVFEVWSGINHAGRTPMLTQAVVRYIPWPFTMAFLAWLFYHFAVRYANPAYIESLKRGAAGG